MFLDQISGVSGKNSDGMTKFRIDQVTLAMSLRNPTTFCDVLSRIERSISQTSKICYIYYTVESQISEPQLTGCSDYWDWKYAYSNKRLPFVQYTCQFTVTASSSGSARKRDA